MMARFTYTILSQAQPGRAEEYGAWYCGRHLDDVMRMPGVVNAKLFKLDFQRVYDLDAPTYTLMTIYELECEDPEPIIDAIKGSAGSEAMPSTDSLSKVGMIQVAGHLIASRN